MYYLKESQNFVKVASSLTTNFPDTGRFFTKAPIACPIHRSTKVRWRSPTGWINPITLVHSGVLIIIDSGGEQMASTHFTFPFCSWAQKWRTSQANKGGYNVVKYENTIQLLACIYVKLMLSMNLIKIQSQTDRQINT